MRTWYGTHVCIRTAGSVAGFWWTSFPRSLAANAKRSRMRTAGWSNVGEEEERKIARGEMRMRPGREGEGGRLASVARASFRIARG